MWYLRWGMRRVNEIERQPVIVYIHPWEVDPGYVTLTLPLIDCSDDPTTCAPLVGAVTVVVIHVTQQPNYKDLPLDKDMSAFADYDNWSKTDAINACSPNPTDECIWNNFVTHFNLVDQYGDPAAYHSKSLYFLQNCEPHEAMGVTGGPNFGILAEIPVLVR